MSHLLREKKLSRARLRALKQNAQTKIGKAMETLKKLATRYFPTLSQQLGLKAVSIIQTPAEASLRTHAPTSSEEPQTAEKRAHAEHLYRAAEAHDSGEYLYVPDLSAWELYTMASRRRPSSSLWIVSDDWTQHCFWGEAGGQMDGRGKIYQVERHRETHGTDPETICERLLAEGITGSYGIFLAWVTETDPHGEFVSVPEAACRLAYVVDGRLTSAVPVCHKTITEDHRQCRFWAIDDHSLRTRPWTYVGFREVTNPQQIARLYRRLGPLTD